MLGQMLFLNGDNGFKNNIGEDFKKYRSVIFCTSFCSLPSCIFAVFIIYHITYKKAFCFFFFLPPFLYQLLAVFQTEQGVGKLNKDFQNNMLQKHLFNL